MLETSINMKEAAERLREWGIGGTEGDKRNLSGQRRLRGDLALAGVAAEVD